jgi:hypothetical protein
VSIGWDYDDNLTVSMSIEEYEREKPHRLVDLEMILSRRGSRIKGDNLGVSGVEDAVEQASRKENTGGT